MKSPLVVDANVIVRFFLNDHPLLSLQTKKVFDSARTGEIQIYIDEVIVAEVTWVLRSVYKNDKTSIISLFEKFLSQKWIINPRKKLILRAFSHYAKYNLNYVDCWLMTVARSKKLPLTTFDETLDKLAKSS